MIEDTQQKQTQAFIKKSNKVLFQNTNDEDEDAGRNFYQLLVDTTNPTVAAQVVMLAIPQLSSHTQRSRLLRERNKHVEKILHKRAVRARKFGAGAARLEISASGVEVGAGFGTPVEERRLYCLLSAPMVELLEDLDPDLETTSPVHRRHLKTLFWDYMLKVPGVIRLKAQQINCDRKLRKVLGRRVVSFSELPALMKPHRKELTWAQWTDWTAPPVGLAAKASNRMATSGAGAGAERARLPGLR